jgi:hypothetical protein
MSLHANQRKEKDQNDLLRQQGFIRRSIWMMIPAHRGCVHSPPSFWFQEYANNEIKRRKCGFD